MASTTDRSVLLVDDDRDFLIVLQDLLPFHLGQLNIDTATSGTEALALIQRNHYDAIISDVRMPGMDGLDLLKRALKEQPKTPFLLMTAHGDSHLGHEAMELGAYAYLEKPIDRQYFLDCVRRALASPN
ncbi:MAG TPA: response regulator [Nitrospiraceae bacterium]|nr:response regulator [Nitrospiraceae bacterium]